MTTKKPITNIVVQSGFNIFGWGSTEAEAIAVGAENVEDYNGREGGFTPEQFAETLSDKHNHFAGEMIALDDSDNDFDEYMEGNGFTNVAGQWFEEEIEK